MMENGCTARRTAPTAKDCLLKINGKTYCFSKNGYRQSGWKKLEGDYYYFGKQSGDTLYRLRWLRSSANGPIF
ncbi:MAG: hypothetical protein ACLTSZ_16395 [Lachnospiraceae bacterium]